MKAFGWKMQYAELNYCKICNTLSSTEQKSKTTQRDFQGRFSHCANEGGSVYVLSGANSLWRAGTASICVKIFDQQKANQLLVVCMMRLTEQAFLLFFFLRGSMLFVHHKALSRLCISFSDGLRQIRNPTRIARLS